MTQQQLADAIGTSKPQISRLEASKRRLTTIWLEGLQMIGAQRNAQLVRVSADNAHYVAYESKLAELRVRGRVVARLHRI